MVLLKVTFPIESYHKGIETNMQTKNNTKASNPFTKGKDEKDVWKGLLKNAKLINKEDFLKKIGKK